MSVIEHLPALEVALHKAGFPEMSPWWSANIVEFYERNVRQAIWRVGRRGGKSSSICRVLVLEAVFGEHVIPPGDIGVVAIISVSIDEAKQRLRTCRAILDALDVEYDPKITSEIRLTGRPIVFKIFAASMGAVSGFTCVAALCDEVAKWENADGSANPAKEVLASLRPTMATQPNAKLFLSSSPLGMEDAHAEAFDRGTNGFQFVAYAPTWEANPSVTEADTRALEPDERVWLREFKAIPQHAILGAFDPADVIRAFAPRPEVGLLGPTIMVTDPSSGKKDSWTWGMVRWETPLDLGPSFLRLFGIDGIHGAFWKTETGPQVVARLVGRAVDAGALSVHGDQREEFMVTGEFNRLGLGYFPHAWTATSKPSAVQTVRRWFRESLLAIEEHEKLRKELLAFEERITPAGALTFAARGSGHDDYVSLLITAAMANEERYLYSVDRPGEVVALSEEERERKRREDRRRAVQDEKVGGMSRVRAAMQRGGTRK